MTVQAATPIDLTIFDFDCEMLKLRKLGRPANSVALRPPKFAVAQAQALHLACAPVLDSIIATGGDPQLFQI